MIASTNDAAEPGSLRELRVLLVGGRELAAEVGSVCAVEALAPDDWRTPLRAGGAQLLLVEAGERLPSPWAGQLEPLLTACVRAGTARMLWVRASPFDSAFSSLCPLFTRVFSVDEQHLPSLEAAGGREPSTLLAATRLPLDDRPVTGTAERPDPVVWIGGWRPEWPAWWQERLSSVLAAAAARGLRIVGVSPAKLPAGLREHVASTHTGAEDALRRARVVIGADAASASASVVPAVVLDAIACGAAVVTPHEAGLRATGLWYQPPSQGATASRAEHCFVPPVRDRDGAAAELDRLLADDAARERIVDGARRIVARNHTSAHRVATLASAAGYAVVPEPHAPPAPR